MQTKATKARKGKTASPIRRKSSLDKAFKGKRYSKKEVETAPGRSSAHKRTKAIKPAHLDGKRALPNGMMTKMDFQMIVPSTITPERVRAIVKKLRSALTAVSGADLQAHMQTKVTYIDPNAQLVNFSVSEDFQFYLLESKGSVELAEEAIASSIAVVTQVEPSTTPETADYVQALRSSHGGAYSSEELIARLGISREALRQRRESFTIVYWTDPKGHCHYPAWQFTPEMHVRQEVRSVLRSLRSHDTTLVLSRFLVASIGEPPRCALDLINDGRGTEAMEFILKPRE